MPKIATATDAARAVSMSYQYAARDFESILGDDGQPLGWTFATARSSSYGWILADGRISPATEWTRDDAETYARGSV